MLIPYFDFYSDFVFVFPWSRAHRRKANVHHHDAQSQPSSFINTIHAKERQTLARFFFTTNTIYPRHISHLMCIKSHPPHLQHHVDSALLMSLMFLTTMTPFFLTSARYVARRGVTHHEICTGFLDRHR